MDAAKTFQVSANVFKAKGAFKDYESPARNAIRLT
jgi:hypothetical protein